MIVWREQKMSVGNTMIDADHRYLMCLINTVELALRSESYRDVIDIVLEQLEQYAREHFDREEKLQIELRYIRYDQHALRHRELLRELDQIRSRVQALATPDAAAAIAGEIAQLLRHWLVNHIFQEDMLLKPLFAQQRR